MDALPLDFGAISCPPAIEVCGHLGWRSERPASLVAAAVVERLWRYDRITGSEVALAPTHSANIFLAMRREALYTAYGGSRFPGPFSGCFIDTPLARKCVRHGSRPGVTAPGDVGEHSWPHHLRNWPRAH